MNSSQLTLAEKNEIKNSVCGLPDLVISQPSSSKAETNVRKLNPSMHTKLKWLSDCAEKSFIEPSHYSYNDPSRSPTIRRSYGLPVFPSHREYIPCPYKYQLHNTCEDANPYLL
jgi:hypothetical protein